MRGIQPVLEVHHLSKRFRLRQNRPRTIGEALFSAVRGSSKGEGSERTSDLWALRDVSCELAPGAGLGLVGRNGSGKSTMLKMIAGVLLPTSGSVTVRGRLSPLIELAAGFHPDFTGRENVYLNGLILGLSRSFIASRFEEIVDFSGVREFIDVPVKYYSSGMYMRLAFSVATQIQPDLLLIDEVLAVGDESFQQKCIARIHEMRTAGTALVFVSHSRDLVASVCDRVLWLEHGKVRFEGSSAAFLAVPGGVGGSEAVTIHLAVLDATGSPVQLGRPVASVAYATITLSGEGSQTGWRVGLYIAPLGGVAAEPGEVADTVNGVDADIGGPPIRLRIEGIGSQGAYVVRAWAVAGSSRLWSQAVTFGQLGDVAHVRWSVEHGL